MSRLLTWCLIACIVTAGALGCSGNNEITSPLFPGLNRSCSQPASSATTQLWGFFDVAFYPESASFTAIPVRGAVFQVNVTRFLQPPDSPIHLLEVSLDIGASDIPGGYVVADVTVKHPFVGHPRLRGFDVRGIVMGDAGMPGIGPGELWPDLDELRLLNADGYTRWWNPTEFTTYGKIFGYTEGAKSQPGYYASGTINAYKYFADGLDAEAPLSELDLENRGTFSADLGVNTRTYELQFPTPGGAPDLHFNYAITASYNAPITDDDPAYPVESFPITANIPEAFRIDVIDAGSTAFYENASTYGGDLNLEIEVFDWGFHATSVLTDEILGSTIQSPTLFAGQIDLDLAAAIPGITGYSWKIPVTIENVTPTGVNGQEILIRLLSTHPDSYEPDIPGISGFDYPDAPLAAYALWEAEISPIGPQENHPPEVGVIDGPDYLYQDEDGVYTLSYATDLEDGTELTILWDNDGDLDFDDDLDGDDSDLQATLHFPDKFFHDVIARAVDSGGLWTDSELFEVYVEGCPTEVHGDFSGYVIGPGAVDYYVRMEAAYQVVGDYAGWMLTQNAPGEIRLFDTTLPGPWTGVPYITLQNTYDSVDKVFSLDVCDFSGRVVLSLMHPDDVLDPSLFEVYDVDGSYLTQISVGLHREVCAIDTDDNGDLWIVTWENWHDDNGNHEVDPGEGVTSQIQHYVFQDVAPYYLEDVADEYDISGQFPGNNQMWDLVVSYTFDRIYAMRGNYSFSNPWAEYGEIYSWDIAPDGTLTLNELVQNLHVFPGEVKGSYTTYHGSIVGGDIEIDHSSESTEYCRLIAMAKKTPAAGEWGHYFMVMDHDLNPIDTVVIEDQIHRYSFAVKTDKWPFNREICVPSFNNNNTIYMSPAPPGW